MKITYWESVKLFISFSSVYCISTDLPLTIKHFLTSHCLMSYGVKTKQNKNVNSTQKVKSQRQGSPRGLHGISSRVGDYFILIGQLHNLFVHEI